jgi:hypothetical protein
MAEPTDKLTKAVGVMLCRFANHERDCVERDIICMSVEKVATAIIGAVRAHDAGEKKRKRRGMPR